MKKKILSICILVVSLFILTSCASDTVKVEFILNGGFGEITTQEIKVGSTINKPTEPTKEGYLFKGWHLDDEVYDFNKKVTKNIKLIAIWEDKLINLKYYNYLSENNPVITIEVEGYGVMKAQLFPSVAENTVNNFIKYVENNKYTDTLFHRVIAGFMIQGGGMNDTYPPIKGDFSSNGVVNDLKHYRGVLSMARTSAPNSATSQFFVMHETSPHLDGNYAGFGALIEGFDVLDKIANAKTDYYDGPTEHIVIKKVTVELNGYVPKEVVYA